MQNSNDEAERLERATSRGAVSGAKLSANEIELRESWSALAQLIEQADATSEFDEQAFLAKVSTPVERPFPASRRKWSVLLGALAASVLMCVLAGGYLANERWGWGNGLVSREQSLPEKDNPLAKSPVVTPVASNSEFSWDDALDERIDEFNQSLYALESGVYSGDHSLQSLGWQMEEFGQEIDGGSL